MLTGRRRYKKIYQQYDEFKITKINSIKIKFKILDKKIGRRIRYTYENLSGRQLFF